MTRFATQIYGVTRGINRFLRNSSKYKVSFENLRIYTDDKDLITLKTS